MTHAATITPRYSIGEMVSYTDRNGREQMGRVKRIEAKWYERHTSLTYTVEHPSYHNNRAIIGAADING